MALNVSELKSDVSKVLSAADEVLAVLTDLDTLPFVDKITPFVTLAQKVLGEVQEFLEA
jgi:hypothetical protein